MNIVKVKPNNLCSKTELKIWGNQIKRCRYYQGLSGCIVYRVICGTFAFMDETFEIPVFYKNDELSFTAQLLAFGYVHKFQVDVYGRNFFFEQDDSGDYRALIDPSELDDIKTIDVDLLKAIAASIEAILK